MFGKLKKPDRDRREFAYRVAAGEPVADAADATGECAEAAAADPAVGTLVRRVNRAAVARVSETGAIADRVALLCRVGEMADGTFADFASLVGLPWGEFCERLAAHPRRRSVKSAERKIDRGTGEAYCASVTLYDHVQVAKLLVDAMGWTRPQGDGGEKAERNVIVLPAQEGVDAPPDEEMGGGGGGD